MELVFFFGGYLRIWWIFEIKSENVELVGFARLETNIWAQKPHQPKVKHVCTQKTGGFSLEFCQKRKKHFSKSDILEPRKPQYWQ